MTIPAETLEQHTAVLGKTGSGKTSTAKLCVEQVVAGAGRVCVLDPKQLIEEPGRGTVRASENLF